MLKTDQQKIENELTQFISNKLLTEFRDSKLRPIDRIEHIEILAFKFDDENQDRNKIIVKEFYAVVRVHILLDDGSTSSEDTQVKNDKPIEFIVNHELDVLELVHSDVKILEYGLRQAQPPRGEG